MKDNGQKRVGWNPWHGCTKVSPGCKYCYVYRQDEMYGAEGASCICRKNGDFDLPVRRVRGEYKIPSGSVVYTCFTSDFLLKDADEWRDECWEMMKTRSDCAFIFFTKRPERLKASFPDDWGEGYENVIIGCTVENNEMAKKRLPEFLSLPIKHRAIIAEPLLEKLEISDYLRPGKAELVSAGGESGPKARECDFSWVEGLKKQCEDCGVPFHFHQTGANFVKDGKVYRIRRKYQHSQAKMAGLNYKTDEAFLPEGITLNLTTASENELTLWD